MGRRSSDGASSSSERPPGGRSKGKGNGKSKGNGAIFGRGDVHRNSSHAAMARVAAFWRGGRLEESLHLCLNRCRHARNGMCEDRGKCREAMDCSDCGVRAYRQPPPASRAKKVVVPALARRRAAWKRWVVPPSLLDVCLCTLMTADRVPSLHRLASSWTHLLSVAYLADDFEADAAAGFKLLELDGRPVPHKEQLTLSVVEDRGYRYPKSRFPFNLLRNIAVDAAPVDFVCLVDVDFVIYPQRRPGGNGGQSGGGSGTQSAAKLLQRWLPLLRLTPHLALVLPAFDANSAQEGATDRMVGVSSKRHLSRMMRNGHAEGFAHSQYPLGHRCDNATRWLHSERPFLAKYSFGCEPYLLYNRRAASRLWEMFVAYGKDRVSFTYELAARGKSAACVLACRPLQQLTHAFSLSLPATQASSLLFSRRCLSSTTGLPPSVRQNTATSRRRGWLVRPAGPTLRTVYISSITIGRDGASKAVSAQRSTSRSSTAAYSVSRNWRTSVCSTVGRRQCDGKVNG